MIKFFRQIRYQLMSENKTGKYFKYAIGEILLVVIGILIALQINNWNIQSVNSKKEITYLEEIKENLKTDLKKIDSILIFNQTKHQTIIEILKDFESPDGRNDAQILGPRFGMVGQYDKFTPNDLGFKNLISSENIGLIKNNELRKKILDYYNFDFKTGTQERIEQVTRDFVDHSVPIMTTSNRFMRFYNVQLDIQSDSDVRLSDDLQFLSNLHLMDVVMGFQNDLLTETQKDILKLIEEIETK